MEKAKRNGRTYKIADAEYNKAQMRGASDTPLATLLEKVAIAYGNGYGIVMRSPAGAMTTIVKSLKKK